MFVSVGYPNDLIHKYKLKMYYEIGKNAKLVYHIAVHLRPVRGSQDSNKSKKSV